MAAAHITQQKWPIFKSIKTTQIHSPPPLSETERRHWKTPTLHNLKSWSRQSAGTQAQSLADGHEPWCFTNGARGGRNTQEAIRRTGTTQPSRSTR